MPIVIPKLITVDPPPLFDPETSATAKRLYAFGNDLDRIEIGMSPGEVEDILGEPGFSLPNNEQILLFTSEYSSPYENIDLLFEAEEGDIQNAALVSINFSKAFELETLSGIKIRMSSLDVIEKIGKPLKTDGSLMGEDLYQDGSDIFYIAYVFGGVNNFGKKSSSKELIWEPIS